jgi:hypothetical protein
MTREPHLLETVCRTLGALDIHPAVVSGNMPIKMLLSVPLGSYATAVNAIVDTIVSA